MADYFCADRITRTRKYTNTLAGRALAFITANEEIAGRAAGIPSRSRS